MGDLLGDYVHRQLGFHQLQRDAAVGVIPGVFYNSAYLNAIVEDEESCASIGSLSVTFIHSEGNITRNQDGYTCSSSSHVKELLNNRDPD